MSPRKLSRVIKTLRDDKGWSQRKLAAETEVTDAYIAQLETGKRKNPSLDVLKRLARALRVPVTDLLE